MTTESSRFDVIAVEILKLRKDFQEETKAHREQIRAELKEHRAEAKLHGRAIEVLLEEVLAQRNGKAVK